MTNCKLSQWHLIANDKWLLSSLTWLPIVLALSIWWIFSQAIVRDLPIAVVDLQKSSLSRLLTREFDATSTLKIDHEFSDIRSAKKALVGNDIYAYMVIPRNFDRDIHLGKAPQVTVFYNSQFILVGKLINGAALQAHGSFNAQVGIMKELAKGNNITSSAFGKTVPIQTQITPLFNKNVNYAQFLVSAIIPALWQMTIVISSIMFLTANHRIYGLKKMFAEKPLKNLLSISFFYLPFFLVQGIAFLTWFYLILDWPMAGSFLPLFFTQLITALACMIMGAFFFFLTLDPAKAMSFGGAFTAPSFAFMGVTFPVSDMNMLAEFWRGLLPISHYIETQISQVSYGVTTWDTIYSFTLPMFGYLIPLFLILLLIKKHLKKLEVNHEAV
jgi:ABC-2 type transport system permease protein